MLTRFIDHLLVCTNIELCGTPKTNIMLYVNYISMKNKPTF